MRLLAISDLHLGHTANREAVQQLAPSPDDWLVLAGDISERIADHRWLFELLVPNFRQIIWVPGNHDLWSEDSGARPLSGPEKYDELVGLCRSFGVLTPEDPFPLWEQDGLRVLLVPLFLLYDYSFSPPHISRSEVLDWSAEAGITCADEKMIDPAPWSRLDDWCRARVAQAELRLESVAKEIPKIFISHFPLTVTTAYVPRLPRFSPWCGTQLTENWPQRFGAKVVVYGHIHLRLTTWEDGVLYREVSLGKPSQWCGDKGVNHYVQTILPDSTFYFPGRKSRAQGCCSTVYR